MFCLVFANMHWGSGSATVGFLPRAWHLKHHLPLAESHSLSDQNHRWLDWVHCQNSIQLDTKVWISFVNYIHTPHTHTRTHIYTSKHAVRVLRQMKATNEGVFWQFSLKDPWVWRQQRGIAIWFRTTEFCIPIMDFEHIINLKNSAKSSVFCRL